MLWSLGVLCCLARLVWVYERLFEVRRKLEVRGTDFEVHGSRSVVRVTHSEVRATHREVLQTLKFQNPEVPKP